MQDAEPLLTTAEAARLLGCTPDNVRRLTRAGALTPAMVVGRGQRLYARHDVEMLARRSDLSAAENAA